MSKGEARALFRGGLLAGAGSIASRALHAAAYAVLARMLPVETFGDVALASVVLGALALLPGCGLGTALLARRGDPRELASSAMTVSMLLGLLLAGVCLVLHPVFERCFDATVAGLIAVVGLSLAFRSTTAVSAALLDRELRFGARAGCELAGAGAFFLSAVGLAFLGLEAAAIGWALVASAAVVAVAQLGVSGLRPARRPDLRALRGLSGIGGIVLSTSLLQWAFVAADPLCVDHRFGREALGFYALALALALLPAQVLGFLCSRLALPALVRARDAGRDSSDGFLWSVRVASGLSVLAAAPLLFVSEPLTALFYGSEKIAAASLLPVLCAYSYGKVIGGLGGPAILAHGRPVIGVGLIVGQLALAVPGALLLPASWGPLGVAASFATATLLSGLVAVAIGAAAQDIPLRAVARAIATPFPALLAALLFLPLEGGAWIGLTVCLLGVLGSLWAPARTFVDALRVHPPQHRPLAVAASGSPENRRNEMLPVTLVVPTYERAELLRKTLPSMLDQEVEEILLVDDGSQVDPTPVVREVSGGDPRVRVLRLGTNRGSPGARNAGADAARQDTVLFVDDDVLLTPGYARTLFEKMQQHGADVVSGRRIWLQDGESPERVDASRLRRVDRRALVEWSHIHYDDEAEFDGDTPLPIVGAIMMVRRELFRTVRYDEQLFRDTGWREETDFQLQAASRGAQLLATPSALCYHLPKSQVGRGGGQRAGRTLRYEWRLFRNNVKFLRKHFPALPALGFAPGPSPVLGALRAYFAFRVPSKIRHVMRWGGP